MQVTPITHDEQLIKTLSKEASNQVLNGWQQLLLENGLLGELTLISSEELNLPDSQCETTDYDYGESY